MSTHKTSSSSNGNGNRLVGWLVSYQLEDLGKAYEIRVGRTLIGGKGSGNGRMIALDTRDVSSPHVAMNASPKHRLMAQDVFSESGSFVARADSGDERPLSGPTELKHGDWLRIGTSMRFQVCLIEGVSR